MERTLSNFSSRSSISQIFAFTTFPFSSFSIHFISFSIHLSLQESIQTDTFGLVIMKILKMKLTVTETKLVSLSLFLKLRDGVRNVELNEMKLKRIGPIVTESGNRNSLFDVQEEREEKDHEMILKKELRSRKKSSRIKSKYSYLSTIHRKTFFFLQIEEGKKGWERNIEREIVKLNWVRSDGKEDEEWSGEREEWRNLCSRCFEKKIKSSSFLFILFTWNYIERKEDFYITNDHRFDKKSISHTPENSSFEYGVKRTGLKRLLSIHESEERERESRRLFYEGCEMSWNKSYSIFLHIFLFSFLFPLLSIRRFIINTLKNMFMMEANM